jgi:hypothetical protein
MKAWLDEVVHHLVSDLCTIATYSIPRLPERGRSVFVLPAFLVFSLLYSRFLLQQELAGVKVRVLAR